LGDNEIYFKSFPSNQKKCEIEAHQMVGLYDGFDLK